MGLDMYLYRKTYVQNWSHHPLEKQHKVTVKVGNKELKGIEAVINTAATSETKTRSSAGRFSSKLTGMRWAYVWTQIEDKGKMTEWLQTLYYGAKKEFGGKNGPFLKIY